MMRVGRVGRAGRAGTSSRSSKRRGLPVARDDRATRIELGLVVQTGGRAARDITWHRICCATRASTRRRHSSGSNRTAFAPASYGYLSVEPRRLALDVAVERRGVERDLGVAGRGEELDGDPPRIVGAAHEVACARLGLEAGDVQPNPSVEIATLRAR
jgi:hypothetical protein